MNKMAKQGECVVEVDQMALLLEIRKDKMYDICNALEGLRLMYRKGRNVYKWQGWRMMLPTLMMLKKMAEKEDMLGQLSLARRLITEDKMEEIIIVTTARKEPELKYNVVMMTQKLLMIFLVLQHPRILSLAEASVIIHGQVLTEAKRKANLQRLDGISKILEGVGLLVKVIMEDDYKNNISYQYRGPEVTIMNTQDDVEMVEEVAAVRNLLDDGEKGEGE